MSLDKALAAAQAEIPECVATGYVDMVSGLNHVPTRNSLTALRVVDTRATYLRASSLLEDAALDKYSFTRDLYLNRRQSQVDDMIDKGIGLGNGE